MSTAEIELPAWSVVSPRRRAHIARVTELALTWAEKMHVSAAERDAWADAARWHDALRDAGEAELRALVPDLDWPSFLLHGPAAAARLEQGGEHRSNVLDAIFWHTAGNARWARTGRVLYMADFLEPGRQFDRERRSHLAASVPEDFDRVFRDVVILRLGEKMASGEKLLPETVELWESAQ